MRYGGYYSGHICYGLEAEARTHPGSVLFQSLNDDQAFVPLSIINTSQNYATNNILLNPELLDCLLAFVPDHLSFVFKEQIDSILNSRGEDEDEDEDENSLDNYGNPEEFYDSIKNTEDPKEIEKIYNENLGNERALIEIIENPNTSEKLFQKIKNLYSRFGSEYLKSKINNTLISLPRMDKNEAIDILLKDTSFGNIKIKLILKRKDLEYKDIKPNLIKICSTYGSIDKDSVDLILEKFTDNAEEIEHNLFEGLIRAHSSRGTNEVLSEIIKNNETYLVEAKNQLFNLKTNISSLSRFLIKEGHLDLKDTQIVDKLIDIGCTLDLRYSDASKYLTESHINKIIEKEKLDLTENGSIQEFILKSPNCPSDILDKLVNKYYDSGCLLKHKNLTQESFERAFNKRLDNFGVSSFENNRFFDRNFISEELAKKVVNVYFENKRNEEDYRNSFLETGEFLLNYEPTSKLWAEKLYNEFKSLHTKNFSENSYRGVEVNERNFKLLEKLLTLDKYRNDNDLNSLFDFMKDTYVSSPRKTRQIL